MMSQTSFRSNLRRCSSVHARGAACIQASPSSSLPRTIPSPPSLPLVGHTLDYLTEPFFPKLLTQWSNTYGGIYQIKLAGTRYVVVTDPALVPDVVGRGSQGLPKAKGYQGWSPMLTDAPDTHGLFTQVATDGTWSAVRRGLAPSLGPNSARHGFDAVLLLANAAAERAAAEGGDNHSKVVDVNHLAQLLTLDVIGRTAFDADFRCLAEPHSALPEMVELGMHECSQRSNGGLRSVLPFLYRDQAARGAAAITAFHDFCLKVLREIRSKDLSQAGRDDIWAQILRLGNLPDGGGIGLPDAQLQAEIATLIVGGYETTANAITWALFAIASTPGVEDKLLHEMRAAGLMPSHSTGTPTFTGGFARPLVFEDLAAMPYLDAIISESMRLYSTTPNGTIRYSPEEWRLGHYVIPADSHVWVPFDALHTSQQMWVEADAFMPERWLPSNGSSGSPGAAVASGGCPLRIASSAAQAAGSLPAATTGAAAAAGGTCPKATTPAGPAHQRAIGYMPFSDGVRSCVGRHLALLEMKVSLLVLLARFELRLASPGGRGAADQDGNTGGGADDLASRVAAVLSSRRVRLTMEPLGGLWMTCRPRSH